MTLMERTASTGSKLTIPRVRKTRVLDMDAFKIDLQKALGHSDIITRKDDTPENTESAPNPPGPNRRLQMDIAYVQKAMFLAHNRSMNSFEVPIEVRDSLKEFINETRSEHPW